MHLRFLPLLLLPFLLTSCATFARREGVQVSLVNLALGESTVWETALSPQLATGWAEVHG